MKSLRVTALLLFACLIAFSTLSSFGCGTKAGSPLSPVSTGPSGGNDSANPSRDVMQDVTRLQGIATQADRGLRLIADASSPSLAPVVVPAGSVDALAAALASAGPGGVVILKRGTHTEHGTVAVTNPATIAGETGAVLACGVQPSNTGVVEAALYVHDTHNVTLWNLTMVPTGPAGGTAILLENASRTTVGWNTISNFQESVLLQNAPTSTVIGNHVVCSTGWQTGGAETDGIINLNGTGVVIAYNDVANGLLDIFCSDANGYALSNHTSGGFTGLILCRVPANSFQLPSGASVGSLVSATHWIAQGNVGSNNLYAGMLVIDGANHNTVINNQGSGNGAYDLELLGVTCLFGFQTPTSFENTVYVGPNSGQTINDFGQNNMIVGTANVTHNISAPCAAAGNVATRSIFQR